MMIETDAGIVRVPAGSAAEHVEHAPVTGHGMQGCTDEHPTVLASVRDLTKGWSYTALVRARGETRLHIDASETAVALQPATLAAWTATSPPTVRRSSPGPAQMLIRDDEDLALEQLAIRPAAGRVDDRLADGVQLRLGRLKSYPTSSGSGVSRGSGQSSHPP